MYFYFVGETLIMAYIFQGCTFTFRGTIFQKQEITIPHPLGIIIPMSVIMVRLEHSLPAEMFMVNLNCVPQSVRNTLSEGDQVECVVRHFPETTPDEDHIVIAKSVKKL